MKKRFPLASVLSITTGRIMCPIDGVYEILSHMTGEDVYTHQIGRCMTECSPWLLRWYPELSTVNSPSRMAELDEVCRTAHGDKMEAVGEWVRGLVGSDGLFEEYLIDRIPADKPA